jgi:tRNA nucleotidyltransferase/poly(A) polymerase
MDPIQVVFRLQDNGFEAFFVGGFVRDMFLGIENKDVDISTSASPDEIMKLFSGQKLDLVGKSFGVVLVNGIEVATFRKDRYFGLSDKNVEITTGTMLQDAERRDFTFNALYLDPFTSKTFDFFDGVKDLQNKVVRFVGKPKDRIYEDPNRIVRACRFRSKIGGTFHSETEEALIKYSDLVESRVAPERIMLEILKAMETTKAGLFFQSLHEIGALKYIFPSLEESLGVDGGKWHQESIWDHNILTGDSISTKNHLLKLTGYLHDVGKVPASSINPQTGEIWFKEHEDVGAEIVSKELENLRFSNEEVSYVSNLIKFHMRMPKGMGPKATRRLLKDLHEVNLSWKDLVRLRLADKAGNLREDVNRSISSAKELVKKFWIELRRPKNLPLSVKDLEVNGLDVMEILKIKPSPQVGKVLKELLELVLDDPDKNIRETLLKEIERRKECET